MASAISVVGPFERTCPVCGATFKPTHWTQRYCPPTDGDRARQNGQARSRWARRAVNAQYRGQELIAPLPAPFDCAHKAAWHRQAERMAGG